MFGERAFNGSQAKKELEHGWLIQLTTHRSARIQWEHSQVQTSIGDGIYGGVDLIV